MLAKTLSGLSGFVVLSSIALLAAGCGVDATGTPDDGDGVSEADAISAKVTPGTFRLYGQPGAQPNAGCDVHTNLVLAASSYSTAHLEEVVGGMCMIAVRPDPRTYRLRLDGTSCGTRVYKGSLTQNGARSEITITDNRARTCLDAIAARIVVEETRDGRTTTKYSYDGDAAGGEVTVTGKLVHTVGIGGENTGTSIQTTTETTELVLDAGERNQFVENKTARVKGTVTYLSGVETHDRKAIDVSEMLVCPDPGWINCMPAREVRPLCTPENRSWIEANCAGVSFAD